MLVIEYFDTFEHYCFEKYDIETVQSTIMSLK